MVSITEGVLAVGPARFHSNRLNPVCSSGFGQTWEPGIACNIELTCQGAASFLPQPQKFSAFRGRTQYDVDMADAAP